MGIRVTALSSLSLTKIFISRLLFLFSVVLAGCFSIWAYLAAQVDESKAEYNTIQARENFRLGVNAFNYGFYNRAIVALEHSLALRPDSPDAVFWLGRSYYANGYVRLGLEQWKILIDQNQAKTSLQSFYNTLDYRYRQVSKLSDPDKYSLFMKLQSHKAAVNRSTYFIGPTAGRAAKDRDEIYIVDYRDNKVVSVDTNGSTKSLLRGSIKQVYDHPFDILLRPKGQGFILSQEGTNSLLFCDENGFPYKEVGGKGTAPDKFLGPQHLKDSGNGYFYVTDWGNRRIAKLDYNGNFIFIFGAAQGNFPGLQGPTGMAILNNKLYVADTLQQKIFLFNQDGHYLETFIDSGLSSPEALLVSEDGNLLIADGNQIKLYDFDQATLRTIYTGGKNRKYIDLNYDRNMNIFAVDFKNEEIDFITPINKLYTDLFVQIDRVITSNYPQISVDLLVEDREGSPIVGLGDENFQVIESNKISPSKLIYTSVDDESIALAIILGSKIDGYRDAIKSLTKSLLPQDSFLLVRGGKTPLVLTNSAKELDDKPALYREDSSNDNGNSPEQNFDISLRFTLDSLVRERKKKIIVFVSGNVSRIAVDTYNISDMKSYLNLQNASMYAVLSEPSKIVSYLVDNTKGQLYTNRNVRSFAKDVQGNRSDLSGYYTLNYTSSAYTDLARRYIPVEVVVRYVRRSGKDELGFFAPLSSVNGTR